VRGVYTVQVGARIHHCTLRGNLKKELEYSTSEALARRVTRVRRHPGRDALAVGDRVQVVVGHQGVGIIEGILPRRTRFSRAGFRGREHTVVCNIDQVVIVFACAEPNPDLWKLDRFLAAAEAEDLSPIVVANKADLADAGPFDEYRALGYRVVVASAKRGAGVEELRELLRAKISAFVGPSGVGKSSLLNSVQPGLELRTGDMGTVTHKGRHTTTSAQLIPLRIGGWVADTPGLRQFELLDLSHEEVADCFPEFRGFVGRCRFDDCRHDSEPDCAIKCAVASGVISRRRYESYLGMVAGA
jgi:ribosome biogenesis GTPase